MYLSVLMFGLVLLPQVHNLQCLQCTDTFGFCSNTTSECPSGGFRCGTMKTMTDIGFGERITTGKSCVLAEQCGVLSASFGGRKSMMNTECCDTDLCNDGNAPEIPATSLNGKKCFTCEGLQCSSILNCKGNEDYCITTSVVYGGVEQTQKGCVSKHMCAENHPLDEVFGGNLKVKCCEGNLCNGACSITAGLLLVMTSLSLVLFS